MNKCRLSYNLSLICFLLLCFTLIIKQGFNSNIMVQVLPIVSNSFTLYLLMAMLTIIIAPRLFQAKMHLVQTICFYTLMSLLAIGILYWFITVSLNTEYKIITSYIFPVAISATSEMSYFSLFILLMPLVYILKGILNEKVYTMQWSLYLTMFYFLHGLTDAYSLSAGRLIAMSETLLSVTLFVLLIVVTRCKKRQNKPSARPQLTK